MPLDDSSCGPGVADHESRDCQTRIGPSRIPSQSTRQAKLHVKTAKRLLDVAEGGLDLNDQYRAQAQVECEEIHPTAVAVMIEADFWPDRPPGTCKQSRHMILKGRVPRVDEPIKVRTIPTQQKIYGGAQRGSHLRNGLDRDSVQLPAFDS